MNANRLLILLSIMTVVFVSLSACRSNEQVLSVGDPAPDFDLMEANGSTVSLSDYRGQPVLLYFHMALG